MVDEAYLRLYRRQLEKIGLGSMEIVNIELAGRPGQYEIRLRQTIEYNWETEHNALEHLLDEDLISDILNSEEVTELIDVEEQKTKEAILRVKELEAQVKELQKYKDCFEVLKSVFKA